MPDRKHVYITGTVQGVGFRASTRRQATEIGVDGWVKNLPDGRVEAVFEGPSDDVDTMVDWCRDGSRTATVEDLTVDAEQPEGLDGFEIRR
ncbi:MAG: acylphosphatase [Halobacteriaceae archaeon]